MPSILYIRECAQDDHLTSRGAEATVETVPCAEALVEMMPTGSILQLL